jgi:2-polyprenyl-3-methyl-5-hydroxy-6-metoxy-1,4-benzoquinol methylase
LFGTACEAPFFKGAIKLDENQNTTMYFNSNTPVYSIDKYNEIVCFLSENAMEGGLLIDVGCASGQLLGVINSKCPQLRLFGVDIAKNYINQCKENIPAAEIICDDISNKTIVEHLQKKFDFVVVGAVLHHIVSRTRKSTLALQERAIENAWALVNPGGYLIVEEPTYSPELIMAIIFHTKRFFSMFTKNRVTLLGHDNNLGAPVVLFLSHEYLRCLILKQEFACLIMDKQNKRPLSKIQRLCGIRKCTGSILIARKSEGKPIS